MPPVFIPMATATPKTTPTVAAQTPPKMTVLEIVPANPTIKRGSTLNLTASAIYSDETMVSLANGTWTSSATGIATVSAGLVTAVAAGHTTITVTANGTSASTTVTVQ